LKHVVVNGTLMEEAARPPAVYTELVQASIDSAQQVLSRIEPDSRFVHCPVCGNVPLEEAFSRHQFGYGHCQQCWSLFALKRPSQEQARWYLHKSPAADFRRGTAYSQQVLPRCRELAVDQADWVEEFITAPRLQTVVVAEPRNTQFLEALARRGFSSLVSLDPSYEPEDDGDLPLQRVARDSDVTDESAHLVAALDVFERQSDPRRFLTQIHRMLQPGGYLLMTTRSGSGFDIQVLWGQADIYPLEHINLPSVEGMQQLLEQVGFVVEEVSTPGLLDVQVVRRVFRQSPSARLPRILKYFLNRRNQLSIDALQQFLQQHQLSSHLRVVARKA
jgi:hypothetical protein